MNGLYITVIAVAAIVALTVLMLTGVIPPADSAKLADSLAVFAAWFLGWVMRQPSFVNGKSE